MPSRWGTSCIVIDLPPSNLPRAGVHCTPQVTAEPGHTGISSEAIATTGQTLMAEGMAIPLMPARHDVADVWERGSETGIGPQGIGGESAHEQLGVDHA